MQTDERARQYPDAVVFAVSFLLDKKLPQNAVTEAEQAKAIAVAATLFPDIINAERAAWLQGDVALLVETLWETLSAQSTTKRSEIIRGALR